MKKRIDIIIDKIKGKVPLVMYITKLDNGGYVTGDNHYVNSLGDLMQQIQKGIEDYEK